MYKTNKIEVRRNKSFQFYVRTKRIIKSKISFERNEKAYFVKGDEDQLYRVFINIIKNADESILEILTKKPNYKGKIDIEITNNKDYIVTTITDNGEGISDTKKAMTPYFTTKKKGTGLGLPIVNKIINEHSGEFIINGGNGTKVEMDICLYSIHFGVRPCPYITKSLGRSF